MLQLFFSYVMSLCIIPPQKFIPLQFPTQMVKCEGLLAKQTLFNSNQKVPKSDTHM